MSSLRHTVRHLIKDRSFTLTALLTLALCIGANTAIFSVISSVLLRPLPVPDADRLVLVYNAYPNAGADRAGAAVPDFYDRQAAVPALEDLALFRRSGSTLGSDKGAERLVAVEATASFYRLARLKPVLGSLFTDEESEQGAAPRALLSYATWQQRYLGDPEIVGRDIRLNGAVATVAGVLPQDFTFLWNDVSLWLPAVFTAEAKSDEGRHSNNWTMVGRLAPGATVEQVQQQVNALNAANDERFPQFSQILKDAGFHTVAVPLQQDVVRDLKPVLYLLWGGVLLVLLLGTVNIANLVTIRSTARARELATRQAMGATPGQLRGQLLSETMLLSIVGGLAGVVIGWWALSAVPLLGLDEIPRGYEIHLDLTTVGLSLLLTLVVGGLIGLIPIARMSRMDVNSTLREEGRSGTAGHAASLLRRGLATAQIAIACVLLVGAGLLVASFRNVIRIDPGFVPEGVVTTTINFPRAGYSDNASVVAAVDRVLDGVRGIAGVEEAGVTSSIPLNDSSNNSVILAEGYVMQPGESLISPSRTSVSEGYFEAMQTPLVAGRYFTASDTADAPLVAIVDERLAAKFWPGQDPIGRRLYTPDSINDVMAITERTRFYNVVGVVKEVQIFGLASSIEPVGAYYFSSRQEATRTVFLTLRTSVAPESVINSLRAKVASIDPELPVYGIRTMVQRLDDSLVGRRVPMLLAMAFAFVALFLSAIGVYGVLAYQVGQRRREIGIRMALGSSNREVFSLVLLDGIKIAAAGLVVGIAGTYFAGRVMQGQLYDIAPMDPYVVGGVAALLAVVALTATVIPARRASRVNPLIALSE